MNWQDKGILLSINKYNENSAIAEFYTKNHGKVAGIIFGATSKKNKNYLILGNKLHINYTNKNENKIGSFHIEILEVNTPYFFESRSKLACIIYSIEIIKLLTPENQNNPKIYELLKHLFNFLNQDSWVRDFIFWELNLFKNLGYEINFKDYVKLKNKDGIDIYVLKNDEYKIIPNFLVNNTNNINKIDIINAIEIIGDFLSKSILNENNLQIPSSRNELFKLIQKL
tara:strand:- start:1012 stop:1692 length:681 start_codon:yes stop_codon:yes gene_type:complete